MVFSVQAGMRSGSPVGVPVVHLQIELVVSSVRSDLSLVPLVAVFAVVASLGSAGVV